MAAEKWHDVEGQYQEPRRPQPALSRARSLGTMAMAQAKYPYDSDSSNDGWHSSSDNLDGSMNIPKPMRRRQLSHPADSDHFSPYHAPTATPYTSRARPVATGVGADAGPGGGYRDARSASAPKPVADLPPLPTLPDPNSFPPLPDQVPAAMPLTMAKSKRKTILERIEGWWDLGLLDKRQTVFGGKQ